MRTPIIMLGRTIIVATVLSAPSVGYAQVVTPPSAPPAVDCVQTGSATAPRGNQASGETMSDKLAQSKGVICPPGSGDDIRVTPPDGGRLRVIPPPQAPEPSK